MLSRLVIFLGVIVLAALMQKLNPSFVIDDTKPYVYIDFERIGNRAPLSDDEPSEGLWLRLVNNCNVPIRVRTFATGTNDPGIGLFDEIVTSPVWGGGYKNKSETLHGGPPQEKPPQGYSFEVASQTIISPGEHVLFSVPRNHVSADWHLRVEFELEPPKKGLGPQPYSFVDFTWTMIPAKYRPVDHH